MPDAAKLGVIMKFTIRDVLWTSTVIALITAWVVDSRQQRALIQMGDARLQAADAKLQAIEEGMIQQQLVAAQSAARAKQTQIEQRHEILKLRQLLGRSINDQRDWFEIEVDSHRLLAISPATTDGAAVTLRTLRQAEAETGLDGSRLRHFLEPIQQLRPRNGSYERR